ncbi:MAG: response regulator [Acidobacteria bacterium]|nr:response regulator [Acidobacteriota bacterium]
MTEKKPCILIAEDFEENRIALKLLLKMAGFAVLEAETGGEALARIRSEKPDLVLMDISLPDVDGLQATQQLRSEPEFQNLPIIIVTAYDDPERIAAAQTAGCTDYLVKPIEIDTLKTMIRRHLPAA